MGTAMTPIGRTLPWVPFVHSDQFRLPDGKTDWKAMSLAQIENGEKCYQCGKFECFPKGHRELCGDCKRAESDPSELRHDNFVRCPACKHLFNPLGVDNYNCYGDGDHRANCPECDCEFTFTTHVSYSFTSPELHSRERKENQPTKD